MFTSAPSRRNAAVSRSALPSRFASIASSCHDTRPGYVTFSAGFAPAFSSGAPSFAPSFAPPSPSSSLGAAAAAFFFCLLAAAALMGLDSAPPALKQFVQYTLYQIF